MVQLHHKIRERAPIQTPPRTKTERHQQIKTLNEEYNQICALHPAYDIDSINFSPADKEILQYMEIMEGLAGKLPNYIRIELLGTPTIYI